MSKYENWRELMDECGASGKPAKAWCLEHNISYNTYRGWLKRADEQTTEITSKKFGKIELQETKVPLQEIKLSCGRWTVTVGRGFDAELLVEVLRAVSGLCC